MLEIFETPGSDISPPLNTPPPPKQKWLPNLKKDDSKLFKFLIFLYLKNVLKSEKKLEQTD